VALASARAGNIIGGGDWAQDRIVPDCIRALQRGEAIHVRNPDSTRPWQHVLEPLNGYLTLASRLQALLHPPPGQPRGEPRAGLSRLCSAFNFGPALSSNRPVSALVNELLRHWPGTWRHNQDPAAPHEAGLLNLATDKAFHLLGWQPRWNFERTVQETVGWYRQTPNTDVRDYTRKQITDFFQMP
jgi:CDP-glucose 4,6-dehydratase